MNFSGTGTQKDQLTKKKEQYAEVKIQWSGISH